MTGMNERAVEAQKDSARWFPNFHDDLRNMIVAMAGELGECAELVKKFHRGTLSGGTLLEKLPGELVDLQVYLFNTYAMLNELQKSVLGMPFDWEAQYDRKREYNENRFGSGEQFIDTHRRTAQRGRSAVRRDVPDSLGERRPGVR